MHVPDEDYSRKELIEPKQDSQNWLRLPMPEGGELIEP
jgi:hypothetical protein